MRVQINGQEDSRQAYLNCGDGCHHLDERCPEVGIGGIEDGVFEVERCILRLHRSVEPLNGVSEYRYRHHAFPHTGPVGADSREHVPIWENIPQVNSLKELQPIH